MEREEFYRLKKIQDKKKIIKDKAEKVRLLHIVNLHKEVKYFKFWLRKVS